MAQREANESPSVDTKGMGRPLIQLVEGQRLAVANDCRERIRRGFSKWT
jgi:hypothetical protein